MKYLFRGNYACKEKLNKLHYFRKEKKRKRKRKWCKGRKIPLACARLKIEAFRVEVRGSRDSRVLFSISRGIMLQIKGACSLCPRFVHY